MRRILKFPVYPQPTEVETADVPTFLSAGAQRDAVVVWVEATVGKGKRTPVVGTPTGEAAPLPEDGATFVGTTQILDGIVVHVYHGPTR